MLRFWKRETDLKEIMNVKGSKLGLINTGNIDLVFTFLNT